MPFKYASMAERLIANSVLSVERFYKGTPCWEWIGAIALNRSGMKYGKVGTRYKRGPKKGKNRSEQAHRLAIVHLKGRILRGKQHVLHACNYSLCINPEHIDGGTQRKNVRQCVKEGRHKTPFGKTLETRSSA